MGCSGQIYGFELNHAHIHRVLGYGMKLLQRLKKISSLFYSGSDWNLVVACHLVRPFPQWFAACRCTLPANRQANANHSDGSRPPFLTFIHFVVQSPFDPITYPIAG